jgi:hypothetical protein
VDGLEHPVEVALEQDDVPSADLRCVDHAASWIFDAAGGYCLAETPVSVKFPA